MSQFSILTDVYGNIRLAEARFFGSFYGVLYQCSNPEMFFISSSGSPGRCLRYSAVYESQTLPSPFPG